MADQIKKFLKHGGITCPHCGSENIQEISDIVLDGTYASSQEQCRNCRLIWELEYTLIVTGVRVGQEWYRKPKGSRVTI